MAPSERVNPWFRAFPWNWKCRFSEDELERLAIMTVDGTASDSAAAEWLTREKRIQAGLKTEGR